MRDRAGRRAVAHGRVNGRASGQESSKAQQIVDDGQQSSGNIRSKASGSELDSAEQFGRDSIRLYKR